MVTMSQRAGINLNDGMAGGDEITQNLLANCVRESGGMYCCLCNFRTCHCLRIVQPNSFCVPRWLECSRSRLCLSRIYLG